MRVGKAVAQKAEPRRDKREPFVMRFDVQDIDRQQIAKLRPFNIDRPGQGMRSANAGLAQIRAGHRFVNLAVKRVTRMNLSLIAALHMNHRRDVGVPAIMAFCRAVPQRDGTIDGDEMLSHYFTLSELGPDGRHGVLPGALSRSL